MNAIGSRVARWAISLLACALTPMPAAAVTITGAAVNDAASAQLGSGLEQGYGCSGTDSSSLSCSESMTSVGPVALTVPTGGGSYAVVSTTTGSSSVGAWAFADVSVSEPDPTEIMFEPDLVLSGRLESSVRIGDSAPTSFHTWAAAAASSNDFLQFAVPSLQPGERFLMDLVFGSSAGPFTTQLTGTLTVEDFTSGSVLATFTQSTVVPMRFDLSGLAGDDIRLTLVADVAMYGAAGFGGDAQFPANQFFSGAGGAFELRQVPAPEPRPEMLLSIGLVAVALLGRRRA